VNSGLQRFRNELGDASALSLCRVAVSAMLFWQALEAGRELITDGYFGTAFHLPFLPESFVPSTRIYALLVAARLAAATLATIGVRPRLALFACSLLGLHELLCDRLAYRDDTYALLCIAFIVSLGPCDRAWLIADSRTLQERLAPTWSARLARIQLSIIYVASGGAKLLDTDWRDGIVLAERVTRSAQLGRAHGIPHALVTIVTRLSIASGISKLAIATELFLAFGLWVKRTRIVALWWGIWFHIAIEFVTPMPLFTGAAFSTYLLFATPDSLARKLYFDPSRSKSVIYSRLVATLDWLARFEVRPWTPDGKRGHTIVVMRRDGSRATGIRAFAMICRCVPLLFPLWAPLALLASFTKGGETSARS
jgi:hypothetical protein